MAAPPISPTASKTSPSFFTGYNPDKQVIGNVTLTGTGGWYDGLSSTPGTQITNPAVNVASVPAGFITSNGKNLQSSHYFMYSANSTTDQQRTRTIQVTYRFNDNITQTQDITMNIPANQFNRIGIPLSVFTSINSSGILLSSTVLQTLSPAQGTLLDLFQEFNPNI